MQAQKKFGILFLIVIVAVAITTTIIHSQDSKKSISLKQQTIDQDDIPVAKFDASPPTDVEEKKIREKRKKRFNMKLGPETGVFDSKRFMLSDQMNSTYGGFPSHAPALAAIPAAESDVVIRGKVTKSNASLSEDKTFIFSEFTVKVNNILKNSTSQEIGFENLITVIRGGGAVRFPSGKVIKRLAEGSPMPHIGSEYILFLDYNDEGKDYEIITAYELNNGQIVPLDGLKRDGGIVRQLKSHQSYKGTSETDFLNLVQQAINNSEDLFERKEGL